MDNFLIGHFLTHILDAIFTLSYPQSMQINCSFSCIAFLRLWDLTTNFLCCLLGCMLIGNSETNKMKDKPGWGLGGLTELNDNSDFFGNMYSEIKHSLYPIHILKLNLNNLLFEFCAIHSSR